MKNGKTRIFAGAAYTSGGKTGTAQAVSIRQNEKYNASRLAEHQRDHSLYVAFAPLDAPRVALAVIVENAGFGATAAAPIASTPPRARTARPTPPSAPFDGRPRRSTSSARCARRCGRCPGHMRVRAMRRR